MGDTSDLLERGTNGSTRVKTYKDPAEEVAPWKEYLD